MNKTEKKTLVKIIRYSILSNGLRVDLDLPLGFLWNTQWGQRTVVSHGTERIYAEDLAPDCPPNC
jgi:hypothetical protein